MTVRLGKIAELKEQRGTLVGHYLLARDDDTYKCTCGEEFGPDENLFFAHMDDLMGQGEAKMHAAHSTPPEPHIGPLAVSASTLLEALHTKPTLFDLVKGDLDERDAKGWREHGRAMILSGDLDYVQEAYEEALDQAMYLKGEILKREQGHTCTCCGHVDKL